jgi:hypothetical protein
MDERHPDSAPDAGKSVPFVGSTETQIVHLR